MIHRRRLSERVKDSLLRIITILSRPNTYTFILLALLTLLVVGTILTVLFEQHSTGEPALRQWDAAIIFMLQNVAGVGLGAKVPLTFAGRFSAVIVIVLAAATRALLVAAIVSGFVNRVLTRGKGVKRVNLENHVIICGWNSRAHQIIEVLERDAYGAGAPLVLLAPLEQNPFKDEVKFIHGDPSSAVDLERAGVKQARAAIVITDESEKITHSDSTYDALAVLTVLALKSANPSLHVVVQMREPSNRAHFIRARADEIIASAEMTEGLLARSALNVGIASVYSELLRLDTPQEMFIMDAPNSLEGKDFQAALVHLQIRTGNILVGVLEGDSPILCPPPTYKIHSGTRLVLVGNVTRASPDSSQPAAGTVTA